MEAEPENGDDDQEERHRPFALYVFGHVFDGIERAAPGNELREALRWWGALEPLACSMATKGRARDVFHLVFPLREEIVVRRIGVAALRGLVEAMAARVVAECKEDEVTRPTRPSEWWDVVRYGAQLVGHVGSAPEASPEIAEGMHAVLERWSGAGFDTDEVLAAKRSIRRARPLP